MLSKIKSYLRYFKNNRLYRRPSFFIPTAIIVALLLGYIFIWRGNGEAELVVADTGSVAETVSVSGKTRAINMVDLAFEKSGQVAQVNVTAGQQVAAGQLLVALESGELRATVAAEQAKLDELRRGTRAEELAITEAALDEALRKAYVEADNAIHNTADTFFGPLRKDWRGSLFAFIKDSSLVTDLVEARGEMEEVIFDWRRALDAGGVPPSEAIKNLTQVDVFLDELAIGINELESEGDSNDFTAAEVENYKSLLANTRDAVASALANLNAANRELVLDKTGTAPEVVAAQAARVAQYQAQLNKNYLIAPISGTVTKEEAEVGEIAPAGETLISIISAGNLEVESFVPEVHIGRLVVGNVVTVSLDALPGETFTGRITYIDPAETEVNGVPNYKIKVAFDAVDERLKSGLTANLKVETARKDNVIRLPRFALTEKEGLYFVTKLVNDKPVLSPVTIGIIGTDGMVEITSGIAPGQQVMITEEAE